MKRIAFKNLFPITCKHALILKIPYNIFLWENYQAELFWSIDNGNNTPKETTTTIPILGPYVKIIFALNNCNACFFVCDIGWTNQKQTVDFDEDRYAPIVQFSIVFFFLFFSFLWFFLDLYVYVTRMAKKSYAFLELNCFFNEFMLRSSNFMW